MRRDDIKIADEPSDDRPGDRWMEVPDGSGGFRKVLTWSGVRYRISLITLSIVAGLALLVIAVLPSAAIVKPGELSNPHAQILAGTLTNEHCRSCHSQSSLSPLGWFGGGEEGHKEMTQSGLCMECHRRTISENLASSAHNLPRSVRNELTAAIRLASADSPGGPKARFHLGGTAVDQNAIACSTCHKEHRGDGFDLTTLGNKQCQSCHRVQIGRFAQSHPAWDNWPYGRGGEIEFDHASHRNKHFPKSLSGTQAFDCAMCHSDRGETQSEYAGVVGELDRVATYEQSCMLCHDKAMNVQAAAGIDFVSVPILPHSAVGNLESWPVSVIGPADGLISPLTELLLRSDSDVAEWLRGIPRADLSRLESTSKISDQDLRRFAVALQKLFRGYGGRGHLEVVQRLRAMGISAEPFGNVLRTLPPQMVQSAAVAWFQKPLEILDHTAADQWPQFRRFDPWSRQSDSQLSDWGLRPVRQVLADDEDLLGGGLLLDDVGGDSEGDSLLDGGLLSEPLLGPSEGDPLDSDLLTTDSLAASDSAPNQEVETDALDPRQRVTQGGWYRDDALMAIRYRAQGHADPVMVGLIETFAQLSEHDPLKTRFFETPFVSACVGCHTSANSVPSRWRAEPKIGRRDSFTKFSHRPHLNISALGDCRHCHRLSGATHRDGTASSPTVGSAASSEFDPLTVEDCAACHHPEAAGDNCTQCHRYHLNGF